MGEKVQYEDLVENIVDGTVNAHKLYCPYNNCSSLILSPGVGVLQRRPKIPKVSFRFTILITANFNTVSQLI